MRRELGRNSSNAGKPPSSDTLADRARQAEERLSRAERRRLAREKAKKFLKERVKRRPGKQPGAAGYAFGNDRFLTEVAKDKKLRSTDRSSVAATGQRPQTLRRLGLSQRPERSSGHSRGP